MKWYHWVIILAAGALVTFYVMWDKVSTWIQSAVMKGMSGGVLPSKEGRTKKSKNGGGSSEPRRFAVNAATQGGVATMPGGSATAEQAGKIDAALYHKGPATSGRATMTGLQLMSLRPATVNSSRSKAPIDNSTSYLRSKGSTSGASLMKARVSGFEFMAQRKQAGQPIMQHPNSTENSGGLGQDDPHSGGGVSIERGTAE